MVAPTRHKDSWANLYECLYEKFTATAGQTDFVVAQTPLKDTVADGNNKPYHRVYKNGVKQAITSVTASTKTYVIAAAALNDIVEITYPKTEKANIRIQQGFDYSMDSKTDDWEELGSSIVHTDLLSSKGSGTLKLLRSDKTELALIEGYRANDTWALLALKDAKSILAKTEYVILPEIKFLGLKGGLAVGGKWTDDYTFSFVGPIETMAVT